MIKSSYRFIVSIILLFGHILLLSSDSDSQEPGNPAGDLKTFTNSIGIEFVLIPSGEFVMGEATREECDTCNAFPDETPRHRVKISKSFYISRYEVTQKQWISIMDTNPSLFKGNDRPVENVSWDSVQLFIRGLNSLEKANVYRLPTEAEWEYAARAGSGDAYCFGDDPAILPKYAWYIITSGAKTHPVGRRLSNTWGLCDIHGNLFEWCQDWYSSDYYSISPQKDPGGPRSGGARVRRGGFWGSSINCCRSSYRDFFPADIPCSNTGFRLLKDMR